MRALEMAPGILRSSGGSGCQTPRAVNAHECHQVSELRHSFAGTRRIPGRSRVVEHFIERGERFLTCRQLLGDLGGRCKGERSPFPIQVLVEIANHTQSAEARHTARSERQVRERRGPFHCGGSLVPADRERRAVIAMPRDERLDARLIGPLCSDEGSEP